MEVNSSFLAPCGLYCGVCGVYYATRDENEKFLKKLLEMYRRGMPGLDEVTTAELECEGCMSDRVSIFCRICAIKSCVKEKGYTGCRECDDFPCAHVENFPMPVGKKVIMRAIPYWREHGTEKWVRDEQNRYLCPGCGHMLFRGANRCNECEIPVDLD